MKKVEHAKSKRFKELEVLVDKSKSYGIEEAVELAQKTSNTKFDSGIEVHVKLGINPKKTDQLVRSSVALPNGNGKSVRVAVITTDATQQKAAKAAGAELIGDQDILNDIKAGKIDFDVLVATPDSMKLLAPIAKILGPKGLMPNPKDGTVTQNIGDAVTSLKKGKVSFKNDDSANIHVMIGKASFETPKLIENYKALIDSILKAKPTGAKGSYIKSVNIASTMGPGIKVSL
ncbi:MAG: 50S ribosomal protein L1 [Candidatus Buchananbacteria bacterium]